VSFTIPGALCAALTRKLSHLVLELRALKRPLNEILRHVYTLIDPPVAHPMFAGSCPVTVSVTL
jgi:hypothetical protein